MAHPFVRLELALGSLASREKVMADLTLLPQAPVVATEELFSLIDLRKLSRSGLGLTDLHLVCCVIFDDSISIWTRNRRPGEIADELGLLASIA